MRTFFARIDIYIIVCAAVLATGCGAAEPRDAKPSGAQAAIWPDYADVTVPCNIAPLNFGIRDDASDFVTVFDGAQGGRIVVKGKDVRIPMKKWRALLRGSAGDAVTVTVYEKRDRQWFSADSFEIRVAAEPIDEYVTYRLIEPTYGMSGEMKIAQRRLSDFTEKEIYCNSADYGRELGQCVNCHSFQNYNAGKMQFHVRQKDGGTVIVRDGKARKVNLKRDGILSAGVYPSWHPYLDLIAYSVNSTYQNFFSKGVHKTEVIDSDSDIVLYDAAEDKVIPVLADTTLLETFPYWAPDGRSLYYACASLDGVKKQNGVIADDYDKVRYNIMQMDFDPDTREFSAPRVVFDAASRGASATFPRLSPDGRNLIFTLGDFGNFHIWHSEADLWVLDIAGGDARKLENINSDNVESYHSWSSNGRWIIFSSRRDDGLYTRLYISYFSEEGTAFKPFLLPQATSDFYKKLIKSYNIPEFTVGETSLSAKDFSRAVGRGVSN